MLFIIHLRFSFTEQAMFKKLLILLPFFWVAQAHAQNAVSKPVVPLQQQQLDALKGTYELKAANARHAFTLPSDLAQIIEKNRKKDEAVQIQLNDNITLIIFSKNQIAGTQPPAKQ